MSLIRHPNGVTLPGAWFEGAQEVKPKAKPVVALHAKAEKQARVLAVLTHHWQDLGTITQQAEMSESPVRTALNKLTERGLAKTKWHQFKMARKRVYMLAGPKG